MAGEFRPKDLLAELQKLQETIPEADAELDEISTHQFRKLRAQVAATDASLRGLLARLDSVRRLAEPFNPASPDVFAKAIADELLLQPAYPLPSLRAFYGSGVYALFYRGSFRAYARIRRTRIPLYVGKADPSDSKAATLEAQGLSLYKRISEHKDSIAEVQAHRKKNLKVADFDFRFLVLDPAWQVVSEGYLIRAFKPVWNKETKVCTGLGKHGDASETRRNRRSAWDTLHPGRVWATHKNIPNKRTARRITQDVLDHCTMYGDKFFANWK